MGTLVAQELGLSYPQRVSRLVLISTAATGQEPVVMGLLNEVVEGEWQSDFSAQGYAWPSGVDDLTPAVAAPDFGTFIDDDWVTSTVAPTSFLDQLRDDTEKVRLGTWIGPLKNIVHHLTTRSACNRLPCRRSCCTASKMTCSAPPTKRP